MARAIHTYRQAGFLASGTRLGGYELIRGLAIGGMADLYYARAVGDRVAAPVVALKRILPHFAAQPDFAAMFLDEAQLLASLHHTNIAQVYEIGNSPLGLFFTMELVEGCDARALLRWSVRLERPIPLQHALAIVMGAAAGLHAAHVHRGPEGQELGIVHRDVSPANVLIGHDGVVKLIDFGIAKARNRRVETRDGTVKGKLAYMSPEQCLGLPIDRRSDIFALGILLYELTTSRRLFNAAGEYAIMEQISYHDASPPSAVLPDYPRELEDILMRALARDPDARWSTAQELSRALDRFASARELIADPAALGAFATAACAEVSAFDPDDGVRRE